MSDIVHAFGGAARFPLESYKGGLGCSDPNCDKAIDAGGSLVYEGTIGTLPPRSALPLMWTDIQNRPGWHNGWPPGMCQGVAVWKLIDTSGDMDGPRYPIADARSLKCDCGAAAADYSISKDGGAGHSDWCKVYNRVG
jgi:hypothetical protein